MRRDKKMKTIRDNKWFEILKSGTLQDIIDSEPWQSQSYIQEQFSLAGGLDRTRITKKGFYFYDIGTGKDDRSFVIRKELKGRK